MRRGAAARIPESGQLTPPNRRNLKRSFANPALDL